MKQEFSALHNLASELVDAAYIRELNQLDEKLYIEVFMQDKPRPKLKN